MVIIHWYIQIDFFYTRWAKQLGDLCMVHTYNVCPLHPSVPPYDLALDVSTAGNVASFTSLA